MFAFHRQAALTDSPITVLLSRRYVNPVVFVQPLSRDEDDGVVARITEVGADYFTSEVVAWWAIQGDGGLAEEMLNTSNGMVGEP